MQKPFKCVSTVHIMLINKIRSHPQFEGRNLNKWRNASSTEHTQDTFLKRNMLKFISITIVERSLNPTLAYISRCPFGTFDTTWRSAYPAYRFKFTSEKKHILVCQQFLFWLYDTREDSAPRERRSHRLIQKVAWKNVGTEYSWKYYVIHVSASFGKVALEVMLFSPQTIRPRRKGSFWCVVW